jgi:hypothetical protein
MGNKKYSIKIRGRGKRKGPDKNPAPEFCLKSYILYL